MTKEDFILEYRPCTAAVLWMRKQKETDMLSLWFKCPRVEWIHWVQMREISNLTAYFDAFVEFMRSFCAKHDTEYVDLHFQVGWDVAVYQKKMTKRQAWNLTRAAAKEYRLKFMFPPLGGNSRKLSLSEGATK